MDERAECELQPCAHRVLCLSCAASLEGALCPACRHAVHALLPLEGALVGAPIAFADVLHARATRNAAARAATLQIVVAAVPDARPAANALIDAIVSAYPPPSPAAPLSATHSAKPPLCGLLRAIRSRAPPQEPSSAKLAAAPPSAAHSLPLPDRFSANAQIGAVAARFALFALPGIAEGAADVRAVSQLLHAHQPDFVLLTARATPRRAARAALEWDARLRSVLGVAELPARSWLFVAADDPRSAANRLASDALAALDACPPRERPAARFSVLQEDAPRPAAKLARSVVRAAARARAARAARPCTHAPVHAAAAAAQDAARNEGARRFAQSFARASSRAVADAAAAAPP